MASLPPEFERAQGVFGGVVQIAADQWETLCPAHDDHKRSLWIRRGDRGLILACRAGCDSRAIIDAAGLEWSDLFQPNIEYMSESPRQLEATYDYTDAAGKLAFQVCRWRPKGFSQRRKPLPSDPPERIKRDWVWTRDGVPHVLYRLPEVVGAKCVIVVEGEKDADRVASLKIRGVAVTTAPMGAGEWRSEYTAALAGKRVIILPDSDEPGRKHATTVAAALAGVASSVRIVELPGLPPKGDVSDWLNAGHTRDDLITQLKGGSPRQGDSAEIAPADALMLAAVAVAGVADSRRAADRLAAFLRAKGVLA